jgi:hypothetical protein
MVTGRTRSGNRWLREAHRTLVCRYHIFEYVRQGQELIPVSHPHAGALT